MSIAPMNAADREPGRMAPGQRTRNGICADSSYGVAFDARIEWCIQPSMGLP